MNSIPVDRRKAWYHRGICLLMAGLTGCGTTAPMVSRRDGRPLPAALATEQIVSTWGFKRDASAVTTNPQIIPGYLLTIKCAEDGKLNGDFRVEFNGDLVLPYDITVNAAGDTLSDLKRKLTALYRPYFKTDYEIDLKLKEQRYWLDVRGLVEKPGRYLVEPDASLDVVIGLAGGLSKTQTPLYVRIQKGSKTFIFDLRRYYNQGENNSQILGWLGGEVLFFQTEPSSPSGGSASSASPKQIYVLGEIKKPGQYTFNSGSDFVDSMVQAGGFTAQANLDHIDVIRQIDGKRSVIPLSWDKLQNAPALQQGDVIMVYADRTTTMEKKVSFFAAIFGTLAAIVTSTILVLSYEKGRF